RPMGPWRRRGGLDAVPGRGLGGGGAVAAGGVVGVAAIAWAQARKAGRVTAPMRITFVLPTANLSGGTRVVAVYAAELMRRGHRVCVVSLPAPRPTLMALVRALVGGGFAGGGGREVSRRGGLA